jgi:hypothetical protein
MPSELLGDFSANEKLFAIFAFTGTLFFLLRIAWMLLGGMGGADIQDLDHNVDGAHVSTDHHDGIDSAFKMLSINSVTAFFMMFGWIGLAASRQFGLGTALSMICALLAGVASMALIAWIFQLFAKLQHSGQKFSVEACVGQTASVYLRIPADGKGRVQIHVGGAQRELDAVSDEKQVIDSFKNVKIVRVIDPRTVAVTLLN